MTDEEIKKEAEAKKNSTTALEEQVKALTAQIEDNKNADINKQNAVNATIALKKKKEDEANLAAEADLKTLLDQSKVDNTNDSGIKINDLTNSELIDVLANAVQTSTNAQIEQALGKVGASINETNDGLRQISKVVGQMVASQGYESVRSGHKDFDLYKEDIFKTLTANPGMQIEDAYFMVKGRKIGDGPGAQNLEMEREVAGEFSATPYGEVNSIQRRAEDEITLQPSGSFNNTDDSNNRQNTGRRGPDPTHGLQGFRDIVNAGVNKIVNERNRR